MKQKVIFAFVLMSAFLSGFGQVTSAGYRNLQVQFFDDEKQLLWVDLREGLLMPVDDVILHDSISIKVLNQYWNHHDELYDVGILEYIKAGQTYDNWEEMIAVQRIDIGLNKARKVYEELKAIREKRCPGNSVYSRIIEESKKELIYETRTENCPGFDDQSEIKIIFVPKFDLLQRTVWIVEYTKKFAEIEPERREEIVNWLKELKFLNNKELQPYLKKMEAKKLSSQ